MRALSTLLVVAFLLSAPSLGVVAADSPVDSAEETVSSETDHPAFSAQEEDGSADGDDSEDESADGDGGDDESADRDDNEDGSADGDNSEDGSTDGDDSDDGSTDGDDGDDGSTGTPDSDTTPEETDTETSDDDTDTENESDDDIEETEMSNGTAGGAGGEGDAGSSLDSGTNPDFPTGPGSPAGAGVAVGAGALAAGAVAHRVLVSGSTGGTAAATNVATTTATTAPRGFAQLVVSTASDLAHRVHTTFVDWYGRFLGTAGYTKWAGDEPLEHDTRADLYDQVRAEPGTYLSAFDDAPALDASLGTLRYHLQILEREGLITSEKIKGRRRFYPVGTSPDTLDIALNDDSTRSILRALAESPDSVSGLAERIDRDPSTVSHHLSRLEDDGLVERERDGQSMTNRLTPGAETVLARRGLFAEAGSAGVERSTADD